MRSSVFGGLLEATKQAYYLECWKNQNLEMVFRNSWLYKLKVSHSYSLVEEQLRHLFSYWQFWNLCSRCSGSNVEWKSFFFSTFFFENQLIPKTLTNLAGRKMLGKKTGDHLHLNIDNQSVTSKQLEDYSISCPKYKLRQLLVIGSGRWGSCYRPTQPDPLTHNNW